MPKQVFFPHSPLEFNPESPYAHIGVKGPTGEPKTTGKAQPNHCDQNPKTSSTTLFSFLVSFDFLIIVFLVLFWCRLAEGEPLSWRRNNKVATPRDFLLVGFYFFVFSSQPRRTAAMSSRASRGARRCCCVETLKLVEKVLKCLFGFLWYF